LEGVELAGQAGVHEEAATRSELIGAQCWPWLGCWRASWW
jgi:hypothetical protein